MTNSQSSIIPIRDLLARSGITIQALRKRIEGVDARIGGGLIVRFSTSPRARIFLDKAKVRLHLPGYIEETDISESGLSAKLDHIIEQIGRVQENVTLTAEMLSDHVTIQVESSGKK